MQTPQLAQVFRRVTCAFYGCSLQTVIKFRCPLDQYHICPDLGFCICGSWLTGNRLLNLLASQETCNSRSSVAARNLRSTPEPAVKGLNVPVQLYLNPTELEGHTSFIQFLLYGQLY